MKIKGKECKNRIPVFFIFNGQLKATKNLLNFEDFVLASVIEMTP